MGSRLIDIDRAKGFTIVLVVFGHIVARETPADNGWYDWAKTVIYQFHMPFFMYLSGFVTFRSSAARVMPGDYLAYLGRRAIRLLAPFLIFGMLIVLGKSLAAMMIKVDNAPGDLAHGLVGLVWATRDSPAVTVWYIFALFVYCAILPPILWLIGRRLWIVLLAALIVYFAPPVEYLYLDRVARYFLFFVLGGMASGFGEPYLRVVDRNVAAFLAAFVAVTAVALAVYADIGNAVPAAVYMIVVSLPAIPALHGLMRIKPANRSLALLFLGKYCFVIYLLNTIVIGVVKGVLLRVLSWDGANFFLFVPVLVAAGLFGPILIKAAIFRRVPAIDAMTD